MLQVGLASGDRLALLVVPGGGLSQGSFKPYISLRDRYSWFCAAKGIGIIGKEGIEHPCWVQFG